jgi:hypothetical protein
MVSRIVSPQPRRFSTAYRFGQAPLGECPSARHGCDRPNVRTVGRSEGASHIGHGVVVEGVISDIIEVGAPKAAHGRADQCGTQ